MAKRYKQRPPRPTIRVHGRATVRTEPDEASVWLTSSALEPTPGTALADVAARGETLARVLDEPGVPSTDRSTTGVAVSEEFDHTHEGRRQLGYRASSTLTARLTDSGRIGRVIMRATTELGAQVSGPAWRVSPENPAWLEAARQASASARTKAAAYAAGVGAALGTLVSLGEPGEPHHAPRFVGRAAAAGADFPIDAGEQGVEATIWAEFELEPQNG